MAYVEQKSFAHCDLAGKCRGLWSLICDDDQDIVVTDQIERYREGDRCPLIPYRSIAMPDG
jgi:hypothetical protein